MESFQYLLLAGARVQWRVGLLRRVAVTGHKSIQRRICQKINGVFIDDGVRFFAEKEW